MKETFNSVDNVTSELTLITYVENDEEDPLDMTTTVMFQYAGGSSYQMTFTLCEVMELSEIMKSVIQDAYVWKTEQDKNTNGY